jgi:hypothetical protein
VTGAGIEYSITPRFALTNEITALRNRMTTYHLTSQETTAGRTMYWMTSVRYAIGLKFTPVSALHLK